MWSQLECLIKFCYSIKKYCTIDPRSSFKIVNCKSGRESLGQKYMLQRKSRIHNKRLHKNDNHFLIRIQLVRMTKNWLIKEKPDKLINCPTTAAGRSESCSGGSLFSLQPESKSPPTGANQPIIPPNPPSPKSLPNPVSSPPDSSHLELSWGHFTS